MASVLLIAPAEQLLQSQRRLEQQGQPGHGDDDEQHHLTSAQVAPRQFRTAPDQQQRGRRQTQVAGAEIPRREPVPRLVSGPGRLLVHGSSSSSPTTLGPIHDTQLDRKAEPPPHVSYFWPPLLPTRDSGTGHRHT